MPIIGAAGNFNRLEKPFDVMTIAQLILKEKNLEKLKCLQPAPHYQASPIASAGTPTARHSILSRPSLD